MAYATTDDYTLFYPNETFIEAELTPLLERASDEIDIMTFGRIRRLEGGVDGLTLYQQRLVKQAVCAQARFHLQYDSMLESGLDAYSINGVSVNLGSLRGSAVKSNGGVETCAAVETLLRQTGLSWRGCV